MLQGSDPVAYAGGLWASDLREISSDSSVLDGSGRWICIVPYSGTPTFLRFSTWSAQPPALSPGSWTGPRTDAWRSSMDRADYVDAVEQTRAAIATGEVYQANICRVLRARLGAADRDITGLHALLLRDNPAPYSFMARVPQLGIQIASASPEMFLTREGQQLVSGPIKGTGRTREDLSEKDRAENVMIVDLVRNDLARVSQVGTVEVPGLLREEAHPGLVHLVSHVSGQLLPGAGWDQILKACFPPGSVTGAPKSSALRIIDALEPQARSYYCGALGWVDADARSAGLAVAIRTFWIDGDELCFGTGAGITWPSDADREWEETELKARHLTAVAAGSWTHEGGGVR